jgi:hypothetical protein
MGHAPECFVMEHRLTLGFLRGETEPKRHAADCNLTQRTFAKVRKKLFHYEEMNVQQFSAYSFAARDNCLKFSNLRSVQVWSPNCHTLATPASARTALQRGGGPKDHI